jgi:hypothetical protein
MVSQLVFLLGAKFRYKNIQSNFGVEDLMGWRSQSVTKLTDALVDEAEKLRSKKIGNSIFLGTGKIV